MQSIGWQKAVTVRRYISRGWTQERVVKTVGVSISTVRRIKRKMDESMLPNKRRATRKLPQTGYLVGKKFNHWTVIRYIKRCKGYTLFLAKCDCGTEREVHIGNIIGGISQSCGCMKRNGEMTAKIKKSQDRGALGDKLNDVYRERAGTLGATIFPDIFHPPETVDELCGKLNSGKMIERGALSHSMQAIYSRSRIFEHVGETVYVNLNMIFELTRKEQGYWTVTGRKI
jgi:hypothetical protein